MTWVECQQASLCGDSHPLPSRTLIHSPRSSLASIPLAGLLWLWLWHTLFKIKLKKKSWGHLLGCPVSLVWGIERDASVWFLRPFPSCLFSYLGWCARSKVQGDLIKFHATVGRTRVEGIKTMASTGPDSVLGRRCRGNWLLVNSFPSTLL